MALTLDEPKGSSGEVPVSKTPKIRFERASIDECWKMICGVIQEISSALLDDLIAFFMLVTKRPVLSESRPY